MMMPKALMEMDQDSDTSPGTGGPGTGGPRQEQPRRRTFTPAQKLAHIQAYEEALEHGEGGAYLRREGLHSASLSEWRRLRDAGVLEGKKPGQKIGRPTKEQTELARLRRELEQTKQELAQSEIALEIMGKTHALLEQLSKSANPDKPGKR